MREGGGGVRGWRGERVVTPIHQAYWHLFVEAMLFLQHKGGVHTPGDVHNSGVGQHQKQEDNGLHYLSGTGRRGENGGCTEDH